MAYCGPRGIPHSRFLRWHPADRAKALAWALEDALRCPGCGTAAWEWEPSQGGSRTAYVPEKTTCEGCNRKEHARDDDDPKGTYVVLVPQDVHVEREMRRAGASLH